MKKMKLYQMWLYLLIGALTTLINIILYWLFSRIVGCSVMVATILSWIGAVFFAFWGNKWVVFNSRVNNATAIMREFLSFIGCRMATGFFDILAMSLFADILGFYDVGVKVISNVLVIIGNYFASKYIFLKKYREYCK